MGRQLVPKSINVSLDSTPVSLLWAHQLRRENAVLLDRFKKTDSLIQDFKSSVAEVKETAKLAADVANDTKIQNEEFRNDLKKTKASTADIEASKQRLHTQVAEFREECRAEFDRANKQQNLVWAELESLKIRVDEQIEAKADKNEMVTVKEQIENLEKQLQKTLQDNNVLVKDSLEGLGRLIRPLDQTITSSNAESEADLNPIFSLTETTQPSQALEISRQSEDETASIQGSAILGDIDLDENVDTFSYAGHHYPSSPPADSMTMLPQPDRVKDILAKGLHTLHQSMFDSWEAYLAHGQRVIDALPRRKEGAVVDAFVEGIFNPVDRAHCEKWLDERHWIWDNLNAFLAGSGMLNGQRTHHGPNSHPVAAQGTSKAQRASENPTHSLRQENLPLEETDSDKLSKIQPRRSQRLAQQHASKSQDDPTTTTDHALPTREAPNQHANNISTKEPARRDKAGRFIRNKTTTKQHPIRRQILDEELPVPVPKLLTAAKLVTIAELPSQARAKMSSNRNRKRKRDFKGHFVRDATDGGDLFSEDGAPLLPQLRASIMLSNSELDKGVEVPADSDAVGGMAVAAAVTAALQRHVNDSRNEERGEEEEESSDSMHKRVIIKRVRMCPQMNKTL